MSRLLLITCHVVRMAAVMHCADGSCSQNWIIFSLSSLETDFDIGLSPISYCAEIFRLLRYFWSFFPFTLIKLSSTVSDHYQSCSFGRFKLFFQTLAHTADPRFLLQVKKTSSFQVYRFRFFNYALAFAPLLLWITAIFCLHFGANKLGYTVDKVPHLQLIFCSISKRPLQISMQISWKSSFCYVGVGKCGTEVLLGE